MKKTLLVVLLFGLALYLAAGQNEDEGQTAVPSEGSEGAEGGDAAESAEGAVDTGPKDPKDCPGVPGTSCKAFAFLEIEVTGGSCDGKAEADCNAVTDAVSQIDKAVEDWWSEDGAYCDEGKADVAARAIGTAIAAVYANAYVKVTCEGEGFACGWAVSGGDAFAIAFAEAIAQASAEAASELEQNEAESFCYADIRALSAVFTSAAADAAADACTDSGTVEDFESSLTTSIADAVAEAFATATAKACAAEGGSEAATVCTGRATSTTEGAEITQDGNTCGGLKKVGACAGAAADMCCAADFKRKFCRCEGEGCPWQRTSKENEEEGTKRSFKAKSGDVCFCN